MFLGTRLLRWPVLAAVTLFAAAPPVDAQQPAVDPQAPWQPAYRFEIGDVVEFKFTFTPELDFTAPVRPDGAISFPYVGDVTLLGLTVPALDETLRERYATVLQMPDLTIIVRSFQTLRVFVTGEVPTPGRLDFRHGMTIAHAVASAGGFLDSANRNEIIVLRPATPTDLAVLVVPVGRRGGEARDLPLAPNDILIVAKSRIARVAQVVRQYSRDLLPIASLGIFFDLVGSTGASVVVGGQ